MALMVSGFPHSDLDILALFRHYNALYFDNKLNFCSVKWSDSWMTSCTGQCNYQKDNCEIILSAPLLRNRSGNDVKNILLHEMIHAYLYLSNNNRRHDSHGSAFQDKMNFINSSTITDYLRPNDGYRITFFHDFHDDVADEIAHKWECESCHEKIKRATPKTPSHSDCIMQVHYMKKTCGNSYCHWHRHKEKCGGTYKKISEPSENQNNMISPLRLFDKKSQEANISQNEGKFHLEGSSQNLEHCFQKKGDSSRKRKFRTETNKKSNSQGAPSIQHDVVSIMLDYYEDEATDEEIEPLVNKRTVRRKKLKMMREGQMERISGVQSLERRLPLCMPGPGFSQDSALEISDDE